jgi:hypothetical protein
LQPAKSKFGRERAESRRAALMLSLPPGEPTDVDWSERAESGAKMLQESRAGSSAATPER